jgi:hypothetical protein
MKFPLFLAWLAVCIAPSLTAQNLRVTARVGTSISTVQDGGSVSVNGRDAIATFSLANAGTTSIRIDQITVGDATASWALITPILLPATLTTNGTLTVSVRYTPISAGASSAPLRIAYIETNQSRVFSATLMASTPDLATFLVDAGGQRTQVSSGGRIVLGSTRPGTPRNASLAIQNRGTAPATLNAVTISGRDFTALVATPALIGAGQEILIPIVFNPQNSGLSTGTLMLDLAGATATFALEGSGASPALLVAYALRTNGNSRPLVNGGTLVFDPTPAATTLLADIVVTNQGDGPASLRAVAITGSAFQLLSLPVLPATLASAQTLRFTVGFNPKQLGSFTGTLRLELDNETIAAAIEGTTSNPEFSLSYIDPSTKNVVPLPQGATLTFPATALESSTSFTILLRNQGPGTGFVNSVSVAGEAFQVTDLPSLPATVAPDGTFQFGLRFSPRQRDTQPGSIAIELPNNVVRVGLAGSGVSGEFTYQVGNAGEESIRLTPNGEIPFNSTAGQTVSKFIRITNVGNTARQIAAITATGAGFAVTNVPFLPVTVPAAGSEIFFVAFSPTQPGVQRGRLLIGEDAFELSGNGIAPRLELAYTNDAGTTQVLEGGTVILTSARVGESSRVQISLKNTGTSAVALSSIEVSPANSVFAMESAPPLPLSVEPGAALNFNLTFSPNNVGAVAGMLRINNSEFSLTANGRQPVPVPEYRITGPGGVQNPLQQIGVGLTLASPYSLPLRGTLNLAFTSDVFTVNPAVQFATGGRAANFTIPANTTQAVFDNGSAEIRLQTGSVAGSIQLTPIFKTTAGLDITPAEPATLSMSVDRAAPRLLTVDIVGRTANSLSLQINGYSTTKTLRTVEVQITPRRDAEFTSSVVRFNVEASALAWFQTSQSDALGGLFSVTIPLTFSRGSSTEDLIQNIQGVNVSVANEVGTSAVVGAAP